MRDAAGSADEFLVCFFVHFVYFVVKVFSIADFAL
jgi:hypothetical protein